MSSPDSPPGKPLVEPLTRREREILGLLAEGFSAPEIAERLTVAVSSVKSHIQHLYAKLDVSSKREALTRAQALGLLGATASAPAPAATVPAEPPGVSNSPPSNLPIQLTHFIGREKELADLQRLLEGGARLMTLTGPGGTGKTRLALQMAGASLAKFPDGMWLVELASVAQASLVPRTVTEAVGLRDLNGRQPVQALAEWLQGKQALLVLDNCEHLVTACAELAEHLLQAAPRLTILATSREPLGLAGEVTYPVPALSLPAPQQLSRAKLLAASEAVRLFVERATAARPDFALTEANAPAVAQICQRLDGIPLALELAAARVRVLSAEQIAERLSDRFRLLAGGSRTAPARQQTLSGAIDWSYDLLSKPEQALLRCLSVFAGGWTLEAAEQVGAGTGDVLDLLAQLVAKSLVISEQQPGKAARFRMLETIREYTYDKLAKAGEARPTRSRHLGYFVSLTETAAPELRCRQQVEWLERLDQESDNWRAALTWALEEENAEAALRLTGALVEYWFLRWMFPEGHYWLTAALRLPGYTGALEHSAWRARALLGAGLLGIDDEPTSSQSRLETSLSLYRELGDRAGMAEVLMRRTLNVDNSPNQAAAAIPLLAEALELWEATGDQGSMGVCLLLTGAAYHALGQRAPAKHFYKLCEQVLSKTGERFYLLFAQIMLAWHSWLDGEPTTARMLLLDVVASATEVGNIGGRRQALANLFEISLALGDYDRAREEALAVRGTTGFPREPASALVRLGQIDYWQGHLAEAGAQFQSALEQFQALNDMNGISWAPPWLGAVANRAGELRQAQTLVEDGLAVNHGGWAELTSALLTGGDVARAQGDIARAVELYTRGLNVILEREAQPYATQYLEAFAKLALAGARPDRAARLLGAADALRTRIGIPVPPVEQTDYDQALASARAQLGLADFEAAWEEGLGMGWEQAAAYALETR